MRLGNKNKADQFISVLPVLWSCASHMAYLSREGRRTSDFLFLSENRRFPLINLITKNGGEIGLLRPPIFYCFCPMTWHVASCIWCLPWRTKPSLPSSRGSTWVIYSRKRPLSENRLRTKVGVWMTLLYLKCFGPSPSTGGVILSSRNNMNDSRRQKGGSFHLRKQNFHSEWHFLISDFRLTVSPHAIPVPHTKLLFDLNRAKSTRDIIAIYSS